MRIRELYLKNFGKFSDRHFCLDDGMQVVYGENEFGKSTLHAFIRAMLFGMERGRGRAAGKDTFSRYEPRENAGYYAGMMRFTCGGRNFRLEREFGRNTRRASLVCEDDGEQLSVEHGDLEMLLGGITPSMFDNTVSVGQLQSMPRQELSEALKNYAANYYETGGGEVDLGGALSELKDRRKAVERSLKEAAEEREKRRQQLLQECSFLERDMERLREEFGEQQRKLEGLEKDGSSTRGDAEKPKLPRGNLCAAGAAGILAGILGFLCSYATDKWMQFAGAGRIAVFAGGIALAGAVLMAIGLYIWLRDRKRQAYEENTWGQAKKKALSEEMGRVQWEMDRVRSEWKEKHIRYENLQEQAEEIEMSDMEKQLRSRHQALLLAREKLEETAAALGQDTSSFLNRHASKIFAEITQGSYRGISVDDKMAVSAWDGVRNVRAEQLSRGTLEQIYFAVRMAAAELLQEEPMPVILDDAFAFYDGKRLESTLKWLSRQERQVIIFTCHNREEEILERLWKAPDVEPVP